MKQDNEQKNQWMSKWTPQIAPNKIPAVLQPSFQWKMMIFDNEKKKSIGNTFLKKGNIKLKWRKRGGRRTSSEWLNSANPLDYIS